MEKFKKVLTEDFIRSSPIWGSKVKKLLIKKLRSANESAAEGNWGPLVALRNHVALQVQSYRLTSKTQSVPKGDFRLRNLPEAYGRGELYTRPHSNVDENRLVEGLKRSLSFQGVMTSTARPDLGIRGGLTATEMRQSEPGYLYTENEFDYLRNIVEEQEAKRKAFQEESNRQWSIYHEKILQLQDPHKLHVESLKKEVGWYYADKILQEEDRQNRIKKDREDNLYRQDMESRHSRMRRQQQAAFQYDTMDEYERFIHEGKRKYGSREKAEKVWIKSISENNKYLKALTKIYPNMSSSMAKSIIKGIGTLKAIAPLSIAYSAIQTSAMSAISRVLDISDRSNARQIGLNILSNYYGRPDTDTFGALLLTGMKPEEFIKSFGQLQMRYGGQAQEIIKSVAMSTEGMEPWMRAIVASSFGIDEQMLYAGNKLIHPAKATKAERITAVENVIEVATDMATSSDAPLAGKIIGYFWKFYDMVTFGAFSKNFARTFSDTVEQANEAAESLESVNRIEQIDKSSTINNTDNKTTSINIGTLNVTANNKEEFIKSIDSQLSFSGLDIALSNSYGMLA